MAIVILVRHGRTAANADGTLAGWTPGISLDDTGREQVRRVGDRLSATPLAAVVSSPLERCRQTAEAIVAGQRPIEASEQNVSPGRVDLAVEVDERIGECHYGAWTGRKLSDLAKEPLWRDVQERPSTVTFPPHDDYRAESLPDMLDRVVDAITTWDQRIEAAHGPGAVWVAVSHGDVIKALVGSAFGSPLDAFQRVVIDPASVSIVRRASQHPFVLRVNDSGSDPVDLTGLSRALAESRPGGPDDDAAVGGGAGSD
ncbi:MSMEG_4193 family putative phosphomutase [Ornithinimicrobium cavernae]|uniref:MSMEG_4193 family putative phosphomutase n=1 Tax=Ornithinimicrobium cavernae TaxID=2666047 RepID=UPI000D68BC33|nr:MSMEG_4193 family putative phosphomutase [Ornithinimicrobium cavernae]